MNAEARNRTCAPIYGWLPHCVRLRRLRQAAAQLFLAGLATRSACDAPSLCISAALFALGDSVSRCLQFDALQHSAMNAEARNRTSAPIYGWLRHCIRLRRLRQAAAQLFLAGRAARSACDAPSLCISAALLAFGGSGSR